LQYRARKRRKRNDIVMFVCYITVANTYELNLEMIGLVIDVVSKQVFGSLSTIVHR
jgi:hypothetical protein